MLVVGGLHVMRRQMTIGDLTVVIAYLGAVYGPLSTIAHTTGQLQGALAGAKRVRAMLALAPETTDAPDGDRRRGHHGATSGSTSVGFQYPDGTDVLHDITFDANPGEMVALVGLTGAGKTTLVSLIPRFYDASAGRVLRRRARCSAIRRRVRCASASPSSSRIRCCFAGTIADNLRYGRLDATREEIEEAARAAHAHDFISRLPKGYDTRHRRSRQRACRAANASG